MPAPWGLRPAAQTSLAEDPCTSERNGRYGNGPYVFCVQVLPFQCEKAPRSPTAQTSSGAAPQIALWLSLKSALPAGIRSVHAVPSQRASVPKSLAAHTSPAPKPHTL